MDSVVYDDVESVFAALTYWVLHEIPQPPKGY
jgi:3-mercaptopyruvate sulfurtransferase SseA